MARAAADKRATVLIEFIMEALKDGRFERGSKLPSEHELMRQTGISRGSVREALSAMELVGVIRRQRGGGTYIRNSSPSVWGVDSKELFFEFLKDAENNHHSFSAYEARIIFEPRVAAIAAQRVQKANLEEFTRILELMRDSVDKKNSEVMVQSDLDFHVAIAKSTQNEVVAKSMRRIIEMAGAQMFRTYQRTNPKAIYEEHKGIFEAIRDGESEAARVCCEYNLLKNYKPL